MQIAPENAAVVVGSVGTLEDVERRILTPALRSIARNVAGGQIHVPVRNPDGTIGRTAAHGSAPGPRTRPRRQPRGARAGDAEALARRGPQGRRRNQGSAARRAGDSAGVADRPHPRAARRPTCAGLRARDRPQQKRSETQRRIYRRRAAAPLAAQIAVQVANQHEAERAALGRAERQFLED